MAKTYNTYKDSGIAWIGEIPEKWGISRMKYCTDIIMGQSPNGEDINDFGTVLFMQGNREFGPVYPRPTVYCDKCTKHSRIGDILMSVRAPVGAINMADKVYGIGRGLCSIKACSIEKDYLKYTLIKSVCDLQSYSTGSTFDAVTTEFLNNFSLVLPSISEQQAIATYLDEKCGEIDSLISLQEEMISELQAYKQSVITEAVTKGLDSNATMKDSGVEWIGMIPEEWSIEFLSKIIWLRARLGWKGLKAEEYVEEGFPFLSAFNIVNNKLKWEGLNFINQERYEESPEIKLSIGDVLIVKDGAGIGKTARIDQLPEGGATVNSSLGVITPSEKLDYKYLHYFLLSNSFQNIIGFIKNGMGVPHLTQENMKSVLITTPPLSEQQAIASYLDEKTSQIDSLIALKQEKITELKDYKKSIIYEYVTGKKKV